MMKNRRPLKAVVLAAGQGKRISTDGSDLPKVMRQANGKPLLKYVLDALDFIAPADIHIVVGYKREQVIEAFPDYGIAVQEQQLGTGHAVKCALDTMGAYEGDVLVCCGDMPLIGRDVYKTLADGHGDGTSCTLLSSVTDVHLPYGRILRDADGKFCEIVEERDCTPEQRGITELNSGVYVFDAADLSSVLGDLKNNNDQGEYYLTDAPGLMGERGMNVGICRLELGKQIIGVNTVEQLREVEQLLLEGQR